jgi:hypothetical protein
MTSTTVSGSGNSGYNPSTSTSLSSCPAGQAISGIIAYQGGSSTSNTMFSDVTIQCSTVQFDGSRDPANTTIVVPSMSNSNRGVMQQALCPTGMFVQSLLPYTSTAINALDVTCGTPAIDCIGQSLVCW